MSPSTVRHPQTDDQRVLQPIRLPERRRSFLGYVARYTRRGTAYAVYAFAVLLAWVIVSPVLPARYAFPPLSSGTDAAPAVPARPKSVPARIPGWAWSMEKWFNHAKHGPRPKAAPTRLPKWFWTWRKWRLSVER